MRVGDEEPQSVVTYSVASSKKLKHIAYGIDSLVGLIPTSISSGSKIYFKGGITIPDSRMVWVTLESIEGEEELVLDAGISSSAIGEDRNWIRALLLEVVDNMKGGEEGGVRVGRENGELRVVKEVVGLSMWEVVGCALTEGCDCGPCITFRMKIVGVV